LSDQERFDKFTERARKVLSLAQEEAQRFQHNYIGTEHLLLGLVREGEGVAAQVLLKLGVELQKVRNSVEFIIGRGDRIVLGQIGLTPRAKKVIELAIDEARQMNHHYIGTEHILLGLVREGEGIAAGVLESLGVRLEQVRKTTLAVLSGISPGAQVISPPVPEQAASLVVEGEPALTCSNCGASCPGYFHYCFNCGERLAQAQE
jgi:ATP-dependent Clp protease ATP-binding subunit ClpC